MSHPSFCMDNVEDPGWCVWCGKETTPRPAPEAELEEDEPGDVGLPERLAGLNVAEALAEIADVPKRLRGGGAP